MSYPKGTGRGTRLGSFLLLSEEEQQERAQGIYDRLPETLRNKLTVADVRNILVANAEMSDVWGEPPWAPRKVLARRRID